MRVREGQEGRITKRHDESVGGDVHYLDYGDGLTVVAAL
jgi:hypothetical protein